MQRHPNRAIRKQSSRTFLGRSLWAIAVGPDLDVGEMRGHARAIIAIGDMATGVVAMGAWRADCLPWVEWRWGA